MKTIMKSFVGAGLAAFTVSAGAMAQSPYYDDLGCRQYADAQIAPLRDQANSQAIGSTILGAGLGAALGAAVGGGRGAGIGAASGAIVAPGLAPPMPRTQQDTCNSNTTRTMRNAWQPGDIRRRHIPHRRRLMRRPQAMPRSRVIRRRDRRATPPAMI